MHELALFAGAGGGLLASRLLGFTTVCAVEIDPYARSVLLARQRDGMLDRFPIWDDIRTFSGSEWRGRIDIVTGGFPCQDISSAGKGRGLEGERSGLWFEMQRVIVEVRPRFVFAENSPMLRTRGLDRVLAGLACLGYDARWCVLGAGDVGAPHQRKRMWILAHTNDAWKRDEPIDAEVESSSGAFKVACDADYSSWADAKGWWSKSVAEGIRDMEPGSSFAGHQGVDDGVANRMDRIRATGNGQVPAVAALAFRVLTCDIDYS